MKKVKSGLFAPLATEDCMLCTLYGRLLVLKCGEKKTDGFLKAPDCKTESSQKHEILEPCFFFCYCCVI